VGLEQKISVIIPTRDTARPETLQAIPSSVKTLVGVDRGEGQTKIRLRLAKKADTKYVLILDDDVVLPEKGLKHLLTLMESNEFDAVCGEIHPIALNGFSKSILKYKENPASFYTTGITLWNRAKFIDLMEDVPPDTHKNVGDLMIGDIIKKRGLKTFKARDVLADHLVETNARDYFKYKYSSGIGFGWYRKHYGGYWSTLLRFFVSIPLSRSRGVLVYRLAMFLGMLKYILLGV
jgi:hypothetical protein